MKLLLVDDDPEIRLIAGFVLRAAGHDVLEAEDSVTAQSLLAAQSVDVLLMDVMLGTEDGIDAARSLIELQHTPPRLVFLTGAGRADHAARMEAAGACGILHKPFDPEALPASLHRILAKAR